MKGGIASYLMQIYRKYFANERFQVIVPNNIGQATDYQSLPFEVYRTDFFPFEHETPSRRQTNRNIVDILRQTNTDIVLFGYLRSHPEAGRDYKKYKSSARTGIITHAKEAFIDNAIVSKNSSSTGAHQGYTQDEAPFYKIVLQSADHVFCISQFTQNVFVHQGIHIRSYILPPSLSTSSLQNKTACKIALGYAPSDFVALSVGRLIDRKGQHRVIEIFHRLQVALPNLHYAIVGDGPNKSHIKETIGVRNLEERVHVHDQVDDVTLAKHYGAADIFVLPTEFIPPNDVEGFGIVFLEAGMHQIPVIGGNSGGVVEAIANGTTGYLINPKSRTELEGKMIELYKSSELRTRMGKQARTRVINRFNDSPSKALITLLS
ncbi:MAG: glycosyltransferase family 4 protein [Candidatus Nanoarchaeia archaeon]